VISYFAQVRTEVEQQGGSVIIVINGWGGLATDRMSFFNLFSLWAERITSRVYASEAMKMPLTIQ
jgi:hypothetical protein